MEIAFWVSMTGLAYAFIGYPALSSFMARFFPLPRVNKGSDPLRVTLVLVVYNGSQLIRARLDNLLSQDHPLLEIIVVSDGSNDGTDLILAGMARDQIRFLSSGSRSGKSACLNLAVEKASGDIIVFADLRQQFRRDTVSQLVGCFSDPKIGAVSGSLEIEESADFIGKGVSAYWNFEKKLRHTESLWDSCIGCTGAVYAIRRALFQPIPSDTLLDDVVIPMQIALLGYRVMFNPDAIAYDPQSLHPAREQIRKRRTLAGNFQMLFRYPRWMLPWRNRLWWQLISHKYLRLLAPFLLLAGFGCNLMLWDHCFYRVLFMAQIGFYVSAIVGNHRSLKTVRVFSFITSFVFLNLMVFQGLLAYFSRENNGAWAGVPDIVDEKLLPPGPKVQD